jgi:hypothetical protein
LDRIALRLLDRLEHEIEAHRNADYLVKDVVYGRCQGLLDAGTMMGLWRGRGGRAVHSARDPTWRAIATCSSIVGGVSGSLFAKRTSLPKATSAKSIVPPHAALQQDPQSDAR